MNLYEYTLLDPSSNDIRLATILTGKSDDPIRIEITHAPLDPSIHDDKPKRLSVKELKEPLFLGDRWTAHETLSGRVVLGDHEKGRTS
ncbi:hypothetical protein F4804DRAFT_315188 [Jackrogersella minutella]|nr:hypothetical protein F4804DRAFT_315188 [Jackrogersella minutella]